MPRKNQMPMHLSPRCNAFARRTKKPCRNGAMPNGRCRMHGGATPRGARHSAFIRGEHTIDTIAERRKAVALNERATELLFEAFRTQTDADRKLRGRLLRPSDAEAQREMTRAQIAAVLVGRAQAPVWDVSANHHIEKKKPMPYVNHYSFHILDAEWAHITIKISVHP